MREVESPDSGSVSRRHLLGALGVVGTAGALTGATTAAVLSDRERFAGNRSGGGELALEIDCSHDDNCAVSETDDSVTVGFDGIEPGDRDSTRIALTVRSNPGRVWLRTNCPAEDPLAETLEISVRERPECEGKGDGRQLADGTVNAVRRELASGVLLDGPLASHENDCFAADTSSCIEVEYTLPDNAGKHLAGRRTSFQLTMYAEQCRHNEAHENPFATDESCPEVSNPDCRPCLAAAEDGAVRIAGASFGYAGPDESRVVIARRFEDGGNRSPERTRTWAFETVDDGDELVVHFDGRGRPDFDVYVDDDRIGSFHTSCSADFCPGLVIGAEEPTLTVLEATDKTGHDICACPEGSEP